MHINTAMFEQNAQSGYVLKPAVMWDKNHPMFNRFNPTERGIEGVQPSTLTVHVSTPSYKGSTQQKEE